MATNNAINLKAAGIVGYDGAGAFVANAVTQYSVQIGGATSSALVSVSNGTTGQFLGANTGAAPTWQTPSGSSVTWNDQGTSITVAAANGYFSTATITLTLPASPNQGDTIYFITDATNILTITGNTGQTIRVGNSVSVSAGSLVNTLRGDAVTLVYRTSGTGWHAVNVIGEWSLT